MERDKLKDLRLEIHSARIEGTNEIEFFQNSVLRQVIKFQHDPILLLVSSHPHYKELTTNKGPRTAFQLHVQQFIVKQKDLKNQLIGCIIGHFTSEEFVEYLKQQNEYNKRIIQMIVQRVMDTLY